MNHPVTLAGKGYLLSYPVNALCALEAQCGPIDALCHTAFSSVRALLWCGLITHQPQMTLEQTGTLMQRHLESGGSLPRLAQQIADALCDALPTESPEEGV